jgi:hypothetical protein
MSFLFEPELLADGVDLKQASAIIERVPGWRRGGRAPAQEHSEPGHTRTAPTAPAVAAPTFPPPRRRRGRVL